MKRMIAAALAGLTAASPAAADQNNDSAVAALKASFADVYGPDSDRYASTLKDGSFAIARERLAEAYREGLHASGIVLALSYPNPANLTGNELAALMSFVDVFRPYTGDPIEPGSPEYLAAECYFAFSAPDDVPQWDAVEHWRGSHYFNRIARVARTYLAAERGEGEEAAEKAMREENVQNGTLSLPFLPLIKDTLGLIGGCAANAASGNFSSQ